MSCEFCKSELSLIVLSTDFGKKVCNDCILEVKDGLRCGNCGITDFEAPLMRVKNESLCPTCITAITGQSTPEIFFPIQNPNGNISIPLNLGDKTLEEVGKKVNDLFENNTPSIFVRLLIYQTLKSYRRKEKELFYEDYQKFNNDDITKIMTDQIKSFKSQGLDPSEFEKMIPSDNDWLNENKNQLLDFYEELANKRKWSIEAEFLEPPKSELENIIRDIYNSKVDQDDKDKIKLHNIIYITEKVLPYWSEYKNKYIINNKTPEEVKVIKIYRYPSSEVDLSDFSHFSNLEDLVINNWDITDITLSDLKQFKKLKSLLIYNCKFQSPISLTDIAVCENLEEFHCHTLHNKMFVKKIKKKFLRTITESIKQGPFTLDLEPFSNCKKLRRISMTSMDYSKIDLQPLSHCIELEWVDFSYNPVQAIDLTPLSKCKKLKFLRLMDMELSEINLKPLKVISNPFYLSLDNNKLSAINLHDLSDWQYLSSLFLRKNPIQSIDLSPLSKCKELSWLILDETGLNDIDFSPLSECTNVEKLTLHWNHLESVDLSPLAKWDKLRVLSFNNNKIKSIDLSPLDSCSSIEEIDLRFNPLENIKLSSFKDRPSVKVKYN